MRGRALRNEVFKIGGELSRALVLGTFLVGAIAQAEVNTVKQTLPSDPKDRVSYTLTAGVSSNVYELNSRDFSASSSLRASIGYQMSELYSLAVGLGISQSLSRTSPTSLSNSTVTVSRKAITLNPDLSLALSGTAVIPTNEASRDDQSYRGSGVASATLIQPFSLLGKASTATYGLSLTRNIHEFTRTASDAPNTMHSASLNAGLSTKLTKKLSTSLSSSLSTYETYQNTRTNYVGFTQSLSYKINKQASVTVGHTSDADLLDSDGQGQNVQLFGEDSSSFFGSLSVSL